MPVSWTSQGDEALRFTPEELEVSRQHIWDSVTKAMLIDFISAQAGDRVLDVGCGTGFLIREIAAHLRQGHFVGLDLDADLLAAARQLSTGHEIEYVEGSVYSLPFTDGSFDLVTAEFLICNLAQPEAAIAECVRVLSVGGHLVCIDPPTAQRFLYSTTIPEWVQQTEHKINSHVAADCAARGIDKAIGIRLPELYMRAGLDTIQVRGHLNARLECQVGSPAEAEARARHQLSMLRRQSRRLQSVVCGGSLTQDDADRYMDFWTERRTQALRNPESVLSDSTCHISTALLVKGRKSCE